MCCNDDQLLTKVPIMEFAPKPKIADKTKTSKMQRRKSRKRVKLDGGWGDASEMQSIYDDGKSCVSGYEFDPTMQVDDEIN